MLLLQRLGVVLTFLFVSDLVSAIPQNGPQSVNHINATPTTMRTATPVARDLFDDYPIPYPYIPPKAPKRTDLPPADCKSWANWSKVWIENSLRRFRLAYGSDRVDLLEERGLTDGIYSKAFWMWAHDKDGLRYNPGCSYEMAGNLQVYWHIDEMSWVIDFSELRGPLGRAAARCQAMHFRQHWEQLMGCNMTQFTGKM